MTSKTSQMFVRLSVRLSVCVMSAFSKPKGSETAGPTSMKRGTYMLWVSGHYVEEWNFEFGSCTVWGHGRDNPPGLG